MKTGKKLNKIVDIQSHRIIFQLKKLFSNLGSLSGISSLPYKINLFLFIVTLISSIFVTFDPPVWCGYGDPYDYLYQSRLSIKDKNFYFPRKTDDFYPRPFTVPLLYKISGSNPASIIQMQKIIHSISTFLFCWVMMYFFKKTSTKIIFILFWYLLMSWWNILGWTHTLLSESLSISFMFLWITTFLWFIRKKTILTISVHGVIVILFSFTRDSWPYVLVLFYSLYILFAIILERRTIRGLVLFLILSLSIFVIQNHSAMVGQRYRLPVMNNIIFRILPNDEYLKWFSEKGLPCIDELKKRYSQFSDWQDIYPMYNDSTLKIFSEWVVNNGKSVYTEFLLFHPNYLFLLNEKQDDLMRIFAFNINYTGDVKGYSWISQYIFPLFNLPNILLLNVFYIFMIYKEKNLIWVLPSVLMIIFSFNAVLLYLADAIEVERHLFITNIMIQFIGILLASFIYDNYNYKTKKKN